MTYKIKKGKHRGWPPIVGIYFKKRSLRRVVVFDSSCKYDVIDGDDLDTNKLFGIGFSSFWRLMWVCISWPVFALLNRKRHHQESARFGWRWEQEKGMMLLSAYCYVNKERVIVDIGLVHLNRPYLLTLELLPFTYEFSVYDMQKMEYVGKKQVHHGPTKDWSYALGFLFGGQKTAPHDVSAKMTKK